MSAFYNEFDPFAAAWLRELVKAGAIEDGTVCEKDMWDVVPSELAGFERVHFCAGIGGWAEALRLAGWPDDQPVWTVSLPCQPFSTAGKGSGLADARGQLAEAFFWLAGVCRPGIIFGEQVEAAIRHDWLDVVASSLESIGYTVGAAAFPASSVGAFHIRQRLYWVAYSKGHGRGQTRESIKLQRSPACGVADAEHSERGAQGYGRNDFDSKETGRQQGAGMPGERGSTGILVDAEDRGRRELRDEAQPGNRRHADGADTPGELGDAKLSGFSIWHNELEKWNIGRTWRQTKDAESRSSVNFWSDAEWIACRDGKARPTQPGLFPLAHGVPNRVGTLRGAGNAIVPQAAAEFIRSVMEVLGE